MENNYVIYHLHSDLSNAFTIMDSTTKFQDYIDAAKSCGMKALAFAEHGSILEWWNKKCAIEEAGMKYIHAVEVYLTETLNEKIRDNYHCVLIAKNYEGFRELNKLVSKSFTRTDNHFYYVPRVSFDELFSTSENIIVTTACIGGVLNKADEAVKEKFIHFMCQNKTRCFLEIGHHLDERQKSYNNNLVKLSTIYGIPLIAGTDTHALNEEHEQGRKILQLSKRVKFDEEDEWNLKFLSYENLVKAYQKQNSLRNLIYLQAIKNTNRLADMVEEYKIDQSVKYPHICENPAEVFKEKIATARTVHPYINNRYTEEMVDSAIEKEFEVYQATDSIDYMLLQAHLREWEAKNNIKCGYGRGSVSGSIIAYILEITKVDSIKFNLSFSRFMNPSRVTNADIDTDYSSEDRDKVKEFALKDHLGLQNIRSSEIVTFNTIALKGAIRDVARAMNIPLAEVADICNKCVNDGSKDIAPDSLRKKYKELFKYVDTVIGTIVSIGTHPSGCLISDLPIDETIGLCSISTSKYPVSMINMKELDSLMYTKLDFLGLDNIGVINETCNMLGIERLEPDNIDLDDENVWKSIRDDTALIFQWESNAAQVYIKQFLSDETIKIAKNTNKDFSYIKWLSFGSGLLRPGCASFRDDVAKGNINHTGFKELDDSLSTTLGRITMQEDIMLFCKDFCGYSDYESDTVRRGIAKKSGTSDLIDEIQDRFIQYSSEKYGVSKEKLIEIFPPIKQGILDASDYAFSWNHSVAYSLIGYICGYLRYYYPIEFITAALNIFESKADKTAAIVKYAKKIGIKIISPKFGFSKSNYFFNKERNTIAKGINSIKFMNKNIAEELYELSQQKSYKFFIDLLYDINEQTTANSKQIDILIKMDFFTEFGNQRELLRITDVFEMFKRGKAKQMKKEYVNGSEMEDIVKKCSKDRTKSGAELKSYIINDIFSIMRECEQLIKSLNLSDLSSILKVKNYSDIMGYSGYVSNNEEDRRKLFVKEVYPLKRKRDGKQFGYSILTQSIGSGVESRFTVFNRVYDDTPIKKDDIILCKNYKRDGSYFTLTDYSPLYD